MTNGERFKDLFGLYATEVWAMPEKDFLEWLNTLTTTTEPVKHGKWVLNERGVYQCECGFVPTMEEKIYYNYCPNCGAQMVDEVRNE